MLHFKLKNKAVLLLLLSFIFRFYTVQAQCNGAFNLCQKRYDKVAYLTTHNAYNNTENNFSLPNQTYNITRQLNDGVRALMIDVYDKNGEPTVYHGFSVFGSEPLSNNLYEIKNFLDNNPNEIVTVIFETYTTPVAIEQSLQQTGLFSYLFVKNPMSAWPTLQEMIDSNKRLVVFSEKNDAGPNQDWYHFLWEHAVETHFSVSSPDNFMCDFNRGQEENDLFIFNHFITGSLGTGSISQAEIVNANPFFYDRISDCIQVHNKFPNFITVDFYETGNCFDVIDALNNLNLSVENINSKESTSIYIFPNPVSDILNIEIQTSLSTPFNLQIFSLNDYTLKKITAYSNHLEISTQSFCPGIYSLIITDSNGCVKISKFIVIKS
ncbi:MAG: phosphatidylinositol-specific phospholipase C domain-containing protein [Bacteroidales bacterium]|nr:phosphatidylinositol-specific phospholipase C domain-containing protein [Bacteroidales bacterium]